MGSRLEAIRAQQLSDANTPWFYEVQRYVVGGGNTYLPDFWVVEGASMGDVLGLLGNTPTMPDILRFLASTQYRVEDVKGWWRPDHPSYSKVESFRYSFPNIQFQVVVKDKDGWSCQ